MYQHLPIFISGKLKHNWYEIMLFSLDERRLLLHYKKDELIDLIPNKKIMNNKKVQTYSITIN